MPLLDETHALLQRLRPPEDRLASLEVLPELSDQGLGRAMERACKVAGIPHFTPHDLRHRYTSLLVLAGVPLPLVPMIVGHARASVTLDVYSHVCSTSPRSAPGAVRRCYPGATKLGFRGRPERRKPRKPGLSGG